MVGGGIAGLSAAVGLGDAGARVLVLEERPMLGGRARSWEDPSTGLPVSVGRHVFLRDYHNTLAFLRRLGTADRVVWQEQPRMRVVSEEDAESRRVPRLPPPLHLLGLSLGAEPARLRDVASNLLVGALSLSLDEDDVVALDALPASAILDGLGVTDRAQHAVWAFVADSIFNVPLERCSAGALLRFAGYLVGRRGPWFGFADGGLGELFEPAREVIEGCGGEVRLGATVRRVIGEERAEGVELRDGSLLQADAVILAVEAPAAGSLLGRWAEALSLPRLEPVPYVAVHLWLDRKVSGERFWARGVDRGGLARDFYDLSNIYRGGLERSVIAANVIGHPEAPELSDAAIVARIFDELVEAVPAARAARVEHAHVERVPMAIHAPVPGSEAARPPNGTAVPGLFLAGDWTRTGLPASMESATRSGHLAAEAVLAESGRERSLAAPVPEARGPAGLLREALLRVRPRPATLARRWVEARRA